MSSGDRRIRIIKQEHRTPLAEPPKISGSHSKTQLQTTREILKTVTSWVEELKAAKKVLIWPRRL